MRSLGVATPDRDDPFRIRPLEGGRLRQVGREAVVGLLADRAGVEDHHVGLLP